MKNKMKLIIIFFLVIILTGCNSKYKGFWCKYNETATIVILLNDDITDADKNKIEEKAATFENLVSSSYYSKEDYKEQLHTNDEIFASFVFSFSSHDSIGSYIDELKTMSGVKEAKQSSAKNNMSLYELKSNGTYTYTDSDEATKNDLITGKYKIEKGIIRLIPDDKSKTKLLYIKNGRLCEDTDCNKIYSHGKDNCSSLID